MRAGGPTHWDLLIAHPPCTYLANSGALHLYYKGKDGHRTRIKDVSRWSDMRQGANFFTRLLGSNVRRICIENPVMHGPGAKMVGRDYAQTIQPYQFGEDASKRTCLWLKNLPPLRPTKYCEPRMVCDACGKGYAYEAAFSKGCPHCGAEAGRAKPRWANQCASGQNKLGPSDHRQADRARTYQGIAEAMAEQWGSLP